MAFIGFHSIENIGFKLHCMLCNLTVDLLICTLISEKQGLDSNLRKIWFSHTWIFFSLSPGFFSGVWYVFLGGDLEKNPGLRDLRFF